MRMEVSLGLQRVGVLDSRAYHSGPGVGVSEASPVTWARTDAFRDQGYLTLAQVRRGLLGERSKFSVLTTRLGTGAPRDKGPYPSF